MASAQIIAEYSSLSGGCTISLVEIAANARLAFRELQSHEGIRAVRAGTLERGLDLARAMIEGRGRPILGARSRSGSWEGRQFPLPKEVRAAGSRNSNPLD